MNKYIKIIPLITITLALSVTSQACKQAEQSMPINVETNANNKNNVNNKDANSRNTDDMGELYIENIHTELGYYTYDELLGKESTITLDKLIDRVIVKNDSYQSPAYEDILFNNIDCGHDGDEETYFIIPFKSTGDCYSLVGVIKNVNDKNYLMYLADMGQLDNITIDNNGFILAESDISYGTNYEVGYLDEDCKYTFCYGINYYTSGLGFSKIDKDDEEWSNIQIQEFYFDSMAKSNDEFCLFYNGDIINDEKYIADFEQNQIDVLSEEEINKKVTDHLNELSIQAQYDLNEDVVPKI